MQPSEIATVEVILSLNGYGEDNITELFEEPFATTYKTKIGFQWYPTAVGPTYIEFLIVVGAPIVKIVGEKIFEKFVEDLYCWVKNRWISFLRKKQFVSSRVYIEFDDYKFEKYTEGTEETINVLTNIANLLKEELNKAEPQNKGLNS